MPRHPPRWCAWAFACLAPAACSSGGSSTPIGGNDPAPQLLACRARVDSPFQFAEVALRTSRNLGSSRVADRTGTERNVRLHPDAVTVVFARERTAGDPASRELFVSTIDGSRSEARLSQNDDLDDEPCWSPDGLRILFASERGGPRGLWITAADGGNAQPFLAAPPGSRDGEPDWCKATDRIVFSRETPGGRHGLWLVQGNGTGLVALTDGGATSGFGSGDRSPSFSVDGSKVAFVRRISASTASLCLVDVATGQVTIRWQPDGDIGTPRWSPADDRIFFGIAEPGRGRSAMRLASASITSGPPVLLWPDERWDLVGLDVFPALAPDPQAGSPQRLDITTAQVQIAAGSGISGVRQQMAEADGDEFLVSTTTVDGREVAGINCRFDLPVALAEGVLELSIRAVARTSRVGGGSVLRMSIYNPVDERFDTAVEITPTSVDPQLLECRTSSLRHVTRERQLRVTVIGDLDAGAAADLLIDLVQVELVARAGG